MARVTIYKKAASIQDLESVKAELEAYEINFEIVENPKTYVLIYSDLDDITVRETIFKYTRTFEVLRGYYGKRKKK